MHCKRREQYRVHRGLRHPASHCRLSAMRRRLVSPLGHASSSEKTSDTAVCNRHCGGGSLACGESSLRRPWSRSDLWSAWRSLIYCLAR